MFRFPPLALPPRRFFSDVLLVLFTALVLCFMAFYNGFPFFYSDSGTYMWTAFSKFPTMDRPLLYGYCMRHASLMTSLWLAAYVQAVCTAVPLYLSFKYFTQSRHYRAYFLVFIFLVTFLTGVSIHTGQLIPDIFAAVMILCLALLFFARRMTLFERILVSVLFVLSVGVHNSHFLIATLLILGSAAVFAFRGKRKILKKVNLSLLRLGYALLLVVAAYLFVSTIHYSKGMKFAVSRHGYVFFMSRLFDCGILEQYLNDNCSRYHYRICAYKDHMPWDLIWDKENSPLYKTGGWEANRTEYNTIIRDILTTPKYWPRLIARETEATFRQFFSFQTGDTHPQEEGSSVMNSIHHHFPEMYKEVVQSRQQSKNLDWRILNVAQTGLMALLFLLSALVFMLRGMDRRFRVYLAFILVALLVNAFVCGAFSGVLDRYQSRVIWLLPLPFMLYLAHTGYRPKRLKKLFRAATRKET